MRASIACTAVESMKILSPHGSRMNRESAEGVTRRHSRGGSRVSAALLLFLWVGLVGTGPRSQASGQTASPEQPRPASPGDITQIQHIVFIIKENRTFDNYFGTFAGADGATSALISTGQLVPLTHMPDPVPRDICHEW